MMRLPSHRWAPLRRFILDRDGWTCQRCGRPGRPEVHHVNGDPGDNDPGNLIVLCRELPYRDAPARGGSRGSRVAGTGC